VTTPTRPHGSEDTGRGYQHADCIGIDSDVGLQGTSDARWTLGALMNGNAGAPVAAAAAVYCTDPARCRYALVSTEIT